MTNRELAARLIRMLENCKLVAYPDSGGVWTIGYGHTAGVKEGDVCTVEQAEAWLIEDLLPLEAIMPLSWAKVQAAAIMSYGYNCGLPQAQRVISGEVKVTPDGFLTPDGKLYGQTARGTKVAGLVSRRRLEAGLFLSA